MVVGLPEVKAQGAAARRLVRDEVEAQGLAGIKLAACEVAVADVGEAAAEEVGARSLRGCARTRSGSTRAFN